MNYKYKKSSIDAAYPKGFSGGDSGGYWWHWLPKRPPLAEIKGRLCFLEMGHHEPIQPFQWQQYIALGANHICAYGCYWKKDMGIDWEAGITKASQCRRFQSEQ